MLPLALKGWKPVEQLSPWRPELKDLLRFLLSNAIISMGDSIPAALASHGQLSCLCLKTEASCQVVLSRSARFYYSPGYPMSA